VVTTLRNELGDHLDGLDGILVPARASTGGHTRMNLDLVISGALDRACDTVGAVRADSLGEGLRMVACGLGSFLLVLVPPRSASLRPA
jgi:hypothetical protein